MHAKGVLRALILLVFAPGVAGSQTIYKCTIKGKPTSYQNAPSAANTTISGIRSRRICREWPAPMAVVALSAMYCRWAVALAPMQNVTAIRGKGR